MRIYGERYERKKNKRDLELIDRFAYFKIWGFMRLDLHLEKTELLVYMIIFGFYISGAGDFTGSRRYLSEWTGSGRTAVKAALENLTEKGYILFDIVNSEDGLLVNYRINPEVLPDCPMFEIERAAIEYMREHGEPFDVYPPESTEDGNGMEDKCDDIDPYTSPELNDD